MTFNTGTATDYVDLLDQLIEVVTSRHLASIAINAAGTGYVAGEVLGITGTGATSTIAAQIEIVAVGGSGEITSARVYRGGAYTVDPTTTTANAATGGSGSSASFDLTFAATGWTQLARSEEAVSATIGDGGTGYAVNDTLTLVGGVLAEGGTAATFNVDSVSSGVVTAVSLVSAGAYEVAPSNSVLTTNDGSGDNACTLDVTWQDVSGDTVVVLQGDAGSAADPLVGIKTYSSETNETGAFTVYNWALFGMTAWSASLALHDQANVSDGFNTAGDGTITTSTSGDGAFVPLKDSDAFNISWWISATGRRVHVVAKVEGASTTYYAEASFGLLNQFGISSEFPFPAYVWGASDRKRAWYRDTSSIWGGFADVIQRNNGPLFVWAPEGSWVEAKNGEISTNNSTTPDYTIEASGDRAFVWPIGAGNQQADANDQIWDVAPITGFDNSDIANGPVAIYRTPDTGGDLFPLYPITVIQQDYIAGDHRTFGELDGCYWFHVADSAISSEDRIVQGSNRYTVFQSGTRIEPHSFFALRED